MAKINIAINCEDGTVTVIERDDEAIELEVSNIDGGVSQIILKEDEINEAIKVMGVIKDRMNPKLNLAGTQRDISSDLNIRYC